MDAAAVLAISGAVVPLVQLLKHWGLPDGRGRPAAAAVSALGVLLWGISFGSFARSQIFAYFAAWIAVTVCAAGVYGYAKPTPPDDPTVPAVVPPATASEEPDLPPRPPQARDPGSA